MKCMRVYNAPPRPVHGSTHYDDVSTLQCLAVSVNDSTVL